MTQDGMNKIKSKLQELTALIKEEAAAGSKELQGDVLKNVSEMKDTLEAKWGDNLQEFVGELEGKALKVQYTLQEKLGQGMAKKDEVVVKAADSLIDAISKVKESLQSKK